MKGQQGARVILSSVCPRGPYHGSPVLTPTATLCRECEDGLRDGSKLRLGLNLLHCCGICSQLEPLLNNIGDCKQVLEGIQQGVPTHLQSSRCIHADLWRKAANLLKNIALIV